MPEADLLNGPEPLHDEEWREIAFGIRQGVCVLVLGPAIAVAPDDPQHTPLTTILARTLAEKLKNESPPPQIVNPDDLSLVSQLFLRKGRNRLEMEVEEFYARYDGKTTPLHRELAQLPFQLVINTTPDSFMETAFKEFNKEPLLDYYDSRGSHHLDVKLDQKRPLIFDLYGSLKSLPSLVLTESDLLDFLINIIRVESALPKIVTRVLGQANTTFLFVGFGFQKWHVRILLRALQTSLQAQRESTSFALETPEFFKYNELPQTVVFFKSHHKIGFRLFSWEEFITELIKHHDDLIKSPVKAAPKLPETEPLAFLSYFHEDKEAVSKLEQRLSEHRIRTWRDTHGLRARGGDDWKRAIAAVLGQVDYVVVVQSNQLALRVESEVYTEIEIALKRKEGIRDGARFVIPTRIDDCANYSKFGELHLQFTDIMNDEGVDALAAAIKDDFARNGPKGRPQS